MATLSDTNIEMFNVTFSDQSSKSVTFGLVYTAIPTVTATPQGNVNVFVKNLTTAGCTIETSDNFSGIVMVHVIE